MRLRTHGVYSELECRMGEISTETISEYSAGPWLYRCSFTFCRSDRNCKYDDDVHLRADKRDWNYQGTGMQSRKYPYAVPCGSCIYRISGWDGRSGPELSDLLGAKPFWGRPSESI